MGQIIADARMHTIKDVKVFSAVNEHHEKAPVRSLKSKYKLQAFIKLYYGSVRPC